MATAAAVSAVIRASRPQHTSKMDRLAFGVHAVLQANGYVLVALGDDVDAPESQARTIEVDLAGWNANQAQYSFLYRSEEDASRKVMVKCLAMEESLLVNVLGLRDGAASSSAPPQTLELDVGKHSAGDDLAAPLQGLGDLVHAVQAALAAAVGSGEGKDASKGGGAGEAKSAGEAAASTSGRQQQQQQQQGAGSGARGEGWNDPLREPPHYGVPMPPRNPLMVGGDDFPGGGVPGRMPGLGGLGPYGPAGGVPGMPGGFGGPDSTGGMMVGPEHPFFADRLRHPDIRPGRGGGMGGPGLGPGGVRWDPIAPEGLQGFHPEDFTREGRRGQGLNDIGRPPPGRGADWDNMFG